MPCEFLVFCNVINGDEDGAVYEWKNVEGLGEKNGHGGVENPKKGKERQRLKQVGGFGVMDAIRGEGKCKEGYDMDAYAVFVVFKKDECFSHEYG